MKYAELAKHLSRPRIDRYLAACGDKKRAISLYKGNLTIAQAFHPLLGVLEVVFRNHLYEAVAIYFKDPAWIIRQKLGFMADRSLAGTNYALRKQVESAERRINRNRYNVTSTRLVAEQNFGFWTDLFEPHHYRLLGGSPIHTFPNLPSGTQRTTVAHALHKVRKFRNRINHNEPTILNKQAVDFAPIEDVYNTIIDVFDWLDADLVGFIKSLDKVNRTISHVRNT